jgi:hypothetical protein
MAVKTRQFRSNGREPYVFRVDHPGDLFGSHADLMREAFGPEDRLLYLLYSPVWEGEEAPFGVRAPSASHAVAVTEDRFIVSEDRHQTGAPATVLTISFDRVIEVELGHALLIGWFALRFVRDGDVVSSSLLFPASTGMLHFAAAIRRYRRATQSAPARSSQEGMAWHEVLGATQTLLASTIQTLIVEGERAEHAVLSSETWSGAARRRKPPVCLSANGILLLTDCGILHAEEQPPLRPEMLSFGVRAVCIPRNALRSAHVIERHLSGKPLLFLRLGVGRNSASVQRDVPFAAENSQAVAQVLARVVELAATGGDQGCGS